MSPLNTLCQNSVERRGWIYLYVMETESLVLRLFVPPSRLLDSLCTELRCCVKLRNITMVRNKR